MIPDRICKYLNDYSVRYEVVPHPRVITAQQLAESIHETGFHVAKSVLVDVDGVDCLVVLPAPERVDPRRLQQELGAHRVQLAPEEELEQRFPDCEVGAEPPFGSLYGIPVIVDERLTRVEDIIFNAGSHDEAVKMSYTSFELLENPRIARFGVEIRQEYPMEPSAEDASLGG